MKLDNKVLKILVVEDNEQTIEILKDILKKQGYIATVARNKVEAISYIENKEFDLILLDVQLPDGTGFEICKNIKQNFWEVPVIFLTGRGEETNVVYGLDIGADDYIIKPFNNNELLSRIKSVMRRYNKNFYVNSIINYKSLKIDLDKAVVYKDGKEIYLTKLEYKILLLFLNNKDKLLTRDEILEKIWDIDGNYVNNNTLSVYIKRLRKKLGETSEDDIIKTIRGIGYILNK